MNDLVAEYQQYQDAGVEEEGEGYEVRPLPSTGKSGSCQRHCHGACLCACLKGSGSVVLNP
jgi:hypothetical protein